MMDISQNFRRKCSSSLKNVVLRKKSLKFYKNVTFKQRIYVQRADLRSTSVVSFHERCFVQRAEFRSTNGVSSNERSYGQRAEKYCKELEYTETFCKLKGCKNFQNKRIENFTLINLPLNLYLIDPSGISFSRKNNVSHKETLTRHSVMHLLENPHAYADLKAEDKLKLLQIDILDSN